MYKSCSLWYRRRSFATLPYLCLGKLQDQPICMSPGILGWYKTVRQLFPMKRPISYALSANRTALYRRWKLGESHTICLYVLLGANVSSALNRFKHVNCQSNSFMIYGKPLISVVFLYAQNNFTGNILVSLRLKYFQFTCLLFYACTLYKLPNVNLHGFYETTSQWRNRRWII